MYGVSQSTNCNGWAAFIQNDLGLLQSAYLPRSISLVSIFQTTYSSRIFSHAKYVCEDIAVVKFLIKTITSPPALLGNGQIARTCSGNMWALYSCSNDLTIPLSLCVNCINPCSSLQSSLSISSCSGNFTAPSKNDQLSNAQVLSVGFVGLIQPPQLMMVNITSSRSTIAVSATMSSAGEMACAVFLSTAAAPTSYDEIQVQNYLSFSDSRNISSVLLTGLQAITQYKIYCFTSSYGVRTAMSTVVDNYFLTSTKCCKYFSVYQSSSSLLEGVNSLNFLTMTLSASPSDFIAVHISLRQLVNETDSISASANFIPNSYQIYGGTSMYSLQLASSLSKLSIGSYVYSIQLNGSSANEYEVVYLSGNNPVFAVITADSVQPAPSLIKAVFSDEGSSITISFDSATNKGGTTTFFNCATLFDFACAGQSQCQWLDSQRVKIYVYGSSSCASPGASFQIAASAAIKAPCLAIGGKCSLYSIWPNATRSAVIIGGPVAAVTPQVVLTVPAVVGSCDSLNIDISSSTGSGGRPWKVAMIQVRRSDNGNISSLQSYLNTTFKATSSSPTLVPSALIRRGFSYIFSVYLCNFLNMCNQASQVVVALETVIPTAYIPGQPIRNTKRSSLVTIASETSVSVCAGENTKSYSLQYSWTISQNGIPLLGMSSISNDPSKFLLSPYSLRSNMFYTIQLTATIKGSLKSAAASCVLFVDVGKIVSVVSGGQSRNMKVLSSISIDASNSYDEDMKGVTGTAAGLVFEWSCFQIAPTLNNTCLNTLSWSSSGSSKSVVTFSSLASSTGTQSVVTVVVQDLSGSRQSSTKVTVTVVSASAPIVSSYSSALNGVINPGQTFQLFGNVIYPDFSRTSPNPVARWSISDISVNLTAVSLTPVSVPLKAASNNVYLVISPSTLPVGSVLSFTLSCCGDTSLPVYSSSITITVNSPPRAGFFQLYPDPGIELQDNFLFSTSQWTDSDLPMQYQFGYITPQGAVVITLSKSLKAYGNSLLPAGSDSANNILSTFVVVFDSLNANSTLPYSVVVHHGHQTNSLEMISTILSSSGNLSSASVDQVKQFNGLVTYLMSKVNCSLAPNCSELHRRECSSTAHTCGSCNSDLYVGESDDSNSMCVLKSSVLSPSSIKTKCLFDFQCSGFQRCIGTSCAVPQKNCISNCSGHGVCMFANSNTGAAVSVCAVDDPSCVAQCACESAYTESLYCAWNNSEIIARQTMKSLVFKNIEHLTSVEYPDTDSLSGWISSLAAASNQVDELSDGSVNSVLRVSSLVLQSAQSVGLGNGALLGLASSLSSAILFVQKSNKLQQRRLFARHLVSTTNKTSSVEETLGQLRQFGLVLASNMLPGQAAVESVQSAFRLSATVVPSYGGAGSSEMAVEVPQSTLEVVTGQKQAAISVPLDKSETAGDSYLHMASISMPSSFSGDALQANPLIVYFSRLPCFSSKTACDIEFTLPTTVSPRLQNDININETANAYCQAGVRSETYYTCSNGYVLNSTCTGDFTGVIRQRCPTMIYNSSCTLLNSGLAAEGGGTQCREVAQSESFIVCKCPVLATSTPIQGPLVKRRLQHVSNHTIQGVHSIAVSTLLVAVAGGIKSTIISAKDLNSDVIGKEVTVLATMVVLAVLIIFFIGISKHLDYKDELNEKESFVVDEKKSIKPISKLHSNTQKRKLRIVANEESAVIEESLPSIFSSQKFAFKLTNEVKQNHKWFGVIFRHSKEYPRVLRAMSLCTNIIVMLFVQSMTYNLTDPDDGTCEILVSQEACRQPKSSFGTGGNKCLWAQQGPASEGSCRFIQPSTDLTVILFVACFSALVTTPISLVLNWLIFRVLAAPTSKSSNHQVLSDPSIEDETRANPNKKIPAAIEDRDSLSSKTAEELNQLSKELQSYRALLGTQQRDEFDSKWFLFKASSKTYLKFNYFYSIELWGLSTNGTVLRKDVADVLLSELAVVAQTIEKERNRIDSMTVRRAKQRRLLYLFQKDFLPGVSGQILHSKVQREDIQVHGAVSMLSKALVYLLILASNSGMLFYVFLFALGQTKYRQDAWFRSFIIWISMEVFVVGTVMVLITHVILPSLIMRDITKIKDKLMDSIRDYQKDLKNKTAEQKADNEEKLFNSAEFFFVSFKLAKLYKDLPVAKIISKYSTPWPRQSYHHVVDVSRSYDMRFSGLSSSVGKVLLFFIGSFLNTPLGVQDGLLHSLFTVVVGYLVLLHIQLYNIQPALAFIPLFIVCIILHFVVLSYRKRSNNGVAAVAPIMEESNGNNDGHAKKLVSRRDSILTGLDYAATAQNYLIKSEKSASLNSISLDSAEIEIFSDHDSEKPVSLGSISLDAAEVIDYNSIQYQEDMDEYQEEDVDDEYKVDGSDDEDGWRYNDSVESKSIESSLINAMVFDPEKSEQSDIEIAV